jgi:hypothetical protein
MAWWKRLLKIDDGIVIDTDPVFNKYCELIEEKSSQYVLEAEELLNNKSLKKKIGNYKIEHGIKGNEHYFHVFRQDKPGVIVVGEYAIMGNSKDEIIESLKDDLAKGEAFALVGNY